MLVEDSFEDTKVAAAALAKLSLENDSPDIPGIKFVNYRDESQLDYVMNLVGRDLSEPYSSKFPLVGSTSYLAPVLSLDGIIAFVFPAPLQYSRIATFCIGFLIYAY
jgi:hypothetical protein